MTSTGICTYCGSSVSSSSVKCPHCGAANPEYVVPVRTAPLVPRSLEELRAYCRARDLPLGRLRYFVGEDYRQPRAFGIYRDGTDFVVYKNKADGTRFIRYRGPCEDTAVNALFEKLLDSCRQAGIEC